MSDTSFLDWPFFEPRHRELSAALALARDCGYRGSEVQQAEAVAARIRTIHLKQLEAERLMAGKFTARATATGY